MQGYGRKDERESDRRAEIMLKIFAFVLRTSPNITEKNFFSGDGSASLFFFSFRVHKILTAKCVYEVAGRLGENSMSDIV